MGVLAKTFKSILRGGEMEMPDQMKAMIAAPPKEGAQQIASSEDYDHTKKRKKGGKASLMVDGGGTGLNI